MPIPVIDGLPANIAHMSTTGTGHFVTPLCLKEVFLALVACSYHGLADAVLYVRPHVRLALFFYLLAPERDMVRFLAEPKTN